MGEEQLQRIAEELRRLRTLKEYEMDVRTMDNGAVYRKNLETTQWELVWPPKGGNPRALPS